MTTSTLTIEDIVKKIGNGTATASDYTLLATLSTAQAEEKKKVEGQAKSLIESIKKAKIDPQILTNLLSSEGLIILPAMKKAEPSLIEESITTPKGRNSKFKVWESRDMTALTGDALGYWTALKGKGKQYFIDNLTDHGKEFYKSEKGQHHIDNLFK